MYACLDIMGSRMSGFVITRQRLLEKGKGERGQTCRATRWALDCRWVERAAGEVKETLQMSQQWEKNNRFAGPQIGEWQSLGLSGKHHRRLLGRGVFRQTLVSQKPLHLSGIWLRDTSSLVVGKPTTPPLPWKSALPPCVLNQNFPLFT
eukprot:g21619.t1